MNQRKQEIRLQADLQVMADKWPSGVVCRSEVKRFTGGILTPGTMANLQSQGKGPASFRIGKKVCYKVVDFIKWLESRINKK